MIKNILLQILEIFRCMLTMPNYKFHKFPYINKYEGKCASVLVNGPSLKQTFLDYDKKEIDIDNNAFFVNLSPLDPHFFMIKPLHFCVSDPMFYQDYLPKKDAIRKMYELLDEKVDWDMNFYIMFPKDSDCDKLIEYSRIKNPHIKFVRINQHHCSKLFATIRHWLYKKGWFLPEDATIATTAIYIALIEGYKTINLYGADHNMCRELAVNQNNELCSYDAHFYDNKEPVLKPFKNTCASEDICWRTHEYFYIMYIMFNSHELLRQFADYMGARIINCTKGSMIDSYERKPGC